METAQAYVASGEYYWNSGMFLFRAGTLSRLKEYSPGYPRCLRKSDERRQIRSRFIRVDEAFLACPEESVDYAVMEPTADAVVVPIRCGLERCWFLVFIIGR
ncbi:sugar phosphate nucleotidyltransferase [Escherichia coli]